MVLSSGARKRVRATGKRILLQTAAGEGEITIVKLHRDDLLTHRAVGLKPPERGKVMVTC